MKFNRLFQRASWIVAVLAILAAIPSTWIIVRYSRQWTGDGLKRHIAAELPLGTSRRQVEAWLDARRAFHCDREDESYAEFHNAFVDWMDNGQLNVHFYFDEADRLTGYAVEAETISL